jgi:hypothetical protein
VPCQIGSTNQSRVVAKVGEHQPGLLAEAAPGQRMAECPSRRQQQEIARGAHSPTDDDHFWIKCCCDIRDPLTKPGPDIG